MAQLKTVIKVKTDTDEFELHGRPCQLSAYSFIPPDRKLSKERTYYNADKKERYTHNAYDRTFLKDFGFNDKLARCDREHHKAMGLCVNCEELPKAVPCLSSSIYGHRINKPLEQQDRSHVRIAYVANEFYRRNGTNMKPHIKEGANLQ